MTADAGQGSSELSGKRLLIVTDSRVWSPGEGRNYRFTQLVSGLRRYGLRMDLVTSRRGLSPEDIESMHAAGITDVITGEGGQAPKRGSALRSTLRRLSPGLVAAAARKVRRARRSLCPASGHQEATVRKLSELRSALLPSLVAGYVDEYAPDFVMVEYLMHSYALEFLKDRPTRIRPVTMIDTHDVAHQRFEAHLSHGDPLPYSLGRDEERQMLSAFDIVIAIQDEDRMTFEAMLPGHTIVTCLPACHADPLPPSSGPHSKRLLFVAGDSRRNACGLAEFLEQVWPDIRSAHPDATLRVAGTVFRRFERESCRGVFFDGYVDDLREAYAGADVVISPITYGAGLKIKVLEALAYGRPVVSTAHGAIGFSGAQADGLLVAEDWNAFASELIDLLGDQERLRALGRTAARYAAREFSEARVMHDLAEAMSAYLKPHWPAGNVPGLQSQPPQVSLPGEPAS